MSASPVLEANAIALNYAGNGPAVLEGFDFALQVGEVVSILGASGVA